MTTSISSPLSPAGCLLQWMCRLRPFLLLWLLSSSEALSVYSSVSLAVHGAPDTGNNKKNAGNSVSGTGGNGILKIFGFGLGKGGGEGKLLAKSKAINRRSSTGVDVCEIQGSKDALGVATTCRGGGSGGGHQEGLPLNLVKLLLSACLTTLSVACWLVPLKVKGFTESKTAVSVANAFSGGVFLSLAFGHMLPHACHGFEGTKYPESAPYYLALSGYLLIFFVEKIAFDTHEMIHDGGHAHHDHSQSPSKVNIPGGGTIVMNGGNTNTHVHTNAGNTSSGRSATILLLALSVHSMFETMALGLANTKLDAFLLAMSIGLHQPAESVALLVSFIKTGLPTKTIAKMLALFSCVGPLGVASGLLVSQYAGKMADAVLVALAAGTFVYVGATEVVADEFEGQEHKWKKFGALLGGVVAIAFITHWAEALEGHTH